MGKLTKEIFKEALKNANISNGDTVLLHSNVAMLGVWDDCKGVEVLQRIKECFFEVLGENGTLVVPAYFYEYARNKESFDLMLTPPSKELGVFSKYIFESGFEHRTINPLTSLIAIGKNAEYIVGGNTGASYGYDTGWDRLLKLNAKMCFLGVDLRVMTFIHHVEHSMCVPHLYQKLFLTPVFNNNKRLEIPICSQVRYMDFDITYDTPKLTEVFEKNNLIQASDLGRGKLRVVGFAETYEFLCSEIKKDLFFLLKNKPTFNENMLPLK